MPRCRSVLCRFAGAAIIASAPSAASASPPPICRGDATGDLRVNFDDIAEVIASWQLDAPHADTDGDGQITFRDISTVLANWNDDCAARFTAGERSVAARILGLTADPCRLYMVGDSISSDSYGQDDTTPTALHYGIARTWLPPNWSGLFIPANGLAGDRFSFVSMPNGFRRAGCSSLAGVGYGLLPVNATEMLFTYNVSPYGPFQQFYITQTASRYGVGPWTANRRLTARVIYLQQPGGILVAPKSWRPQFTIQAQNICNTPAADPVITWCDVSIGPGADPEVGAGIYGIAPDIDESGKRFLCYGCRVFDPLNPGFELAPCGLGGSAPRDHTTLGSVDHWYSNESITQLVAALESNTFWIMLGQNQQDTAPLSGQLNTGNPALYQQYMTDIVNRYHDAAVAAGIERPLFLLVNTYKTAYLPINQETRWIALRNIANQRDDTLAIDLYAMVDDTTGLLVDTVHTNWAGSQFFAGVIWQTLDALGRRDD